MLIKKSLSVALALGAMGLVALPIANAEVDPFNSNQGSYNVAEDTTSTAAAPTADTADKKAQGEKKAEHHCGKKKGEHHCGKKKGEREHKGEHKAKHKGEHKGEHKAEHKANADKKMDATKDADKKPADSSSTAPKAAE